MSYIKSFLLFLWFFLWQLPQNIVGCIVSIICICSDRNCTVTSEDILIVKKFFNSGVCLGDYIIIQRDNYCPSTIKHEKGHQIQSKRWGWFYLFTVGLVSFCRNLYARKFRKNAVWYYSHWPENEADRLGGVDRGF